MSAELWGIGFDGESRGAAVRATRGSETPDLRFASVLARFQILNSPAAGREDAFAYGMIQPVYPLSHAPLREAKTLVEIRSKSWAGI